VLISHYCHVSPQRKELVTPWIHSHGVHCSRQGSELQITLLRLFWNSSDSNTINWLLTEKPGSICSTTTPISAERSIFYRILQFIFFRWSKAVGTWNKPFTSLLFICFPIKHSHRTRHSTFTVALTAELETWKNERFQAVISHDSIKKWKSGV
jgi:hypothetical protein